MTVSQNKINARRVALLGVFLGYTLVIGLLERLIPLSVSIPGLRLGLANVAILLALYLFPWPQALLLAVLKCLLTAIFSGRPSSLIYSVFGTMLSFIVMLALIRLSRERLSPVGVSVAGAACHNIGQILAACLLMQSWAVLAYLPPLLIIGVATGLLIGMLVMKLMKNRHFL